MTRLVDLACVVHVHSRYSDGSGTVAQIAAAGARAGVDVVLLTDHDTLAAKHRGEERWYGPTLVCVGEEVSPRGGNHYLAFGLDEVIRHKGLTPQQIVDAVNQAGGFGFLSHPFSRGSERFSRATAMPWSDLDATGYAGVELWSFVTDSAERLASIREGLRFIATPQRFVDHPPRGNLEIWDRLAARRPVVAIGGLDAHQIGLRIGPFVPLRLMAYARSFRFLRTHVLIDRELRGDADRDRDAVYDALRAGRCYLAMDALAPARGFDFSGEGRERVEQGGETGFDGRLGLHVRTPQPAALTLLRDGEPIVTRQGSTIDHEPERPGVYRVEAQLPAHGRMRTWIVSNPIYVRG